MQLPGCQRCKRAVDLRFWGTHLQVETKSVFCLEDIVTSSVMQLKWSWGAPDPEPEKSWWALLIEAGELVGEWFCQGFVLFCLRYMSLNELGFWKKYINLTVDVQDVKSRQVGLAITSTFRRGKGCLSEGHLQGETKQGSSICDIMRSCRKSERHKSCQIVFQQIKWHVKLDQFDKTEKALTTTLTAELGKVLWLTAQAHHGCLGGLQISTMQCLCTWCIQDLQAHTHKDTKTQTYTHTSHIHTAIFCLKVFRSLARH